MFIHIFAFQWKPEATELLQEQAAAAILAFRDTIPGLIEVQIGHNLSPRNQGYTFGGFMKFTDRAACIAYNSHPAHEELLAWLRPLITPVELDFEA